MDQVSRDFHALWFFGSFNSVLVYRVPGSANTYPAIEKLAG